MQRLLFAVMGNRSCQFKKNVRTVRFRTLTYDIKSDRIIQCPKQAPCAGDSALHSRIGARERKEVNLE